MAHLARSITILALGACALAALSGCSGGAQGTSVPAPTDSPGAALVDQRCTMCHNLDRVYAADYDAAKWAATVDRMEEKNGLVIDGDEKQAIIDYLAQQDSSQ